MHVSSEGTVRLVARHPGTGGASRLVFVADDGVWFEAAIIPETSGGLSLCVPAQAGCAVGCGHCATTFSAPPFVRDLRADEIVGAATAAAAIVAGSFQQLDFGGTGDASLNWAAVRDAGARILDLGAAGSVRVVTIGPLAWARDVLSQASGWRPDAFAFSLEGATRAVRQRVIPAAEDPAELLPLWSELARESRAIVSYTMFEVNTTAADAVALAELLRPHADAFAGLRLGAPNPVKGSALVPSGRQQEFVFEVADLLPEWIVALHRAEGASCGSASGQLTAGREAGPAPGTR